MIIKNYNLYEDKVKPKEFVVNIPIIYEIIKKYVAKIKLENM